MNREEKLSLILNEAKQNLAESIIPFWRDNLPDYENGGFYGEIRLDGTQNNAFPKAFVLNSRLLYTYCKGYSILGDEKCMALADRAYEYISQHFWDPLYEGVFWMLDPKGNPIEGEKRLYAQSFLVYSFAEYYRLTGNAEALAKANRVFDLIMEHCAYPQGGFADSVTRDWRRDNWANIWFMNSKGAPKLLNSHLHLMESMINLYEVAHDPKVLKELKRFVMFIMDSVFEDDIGHLKAGMSVDSRRIDDEISFGHDAECSYLLLKAADLIQDDAVTARAREVALKIVEKCMEQGLDPVNGGIYNTMSYATGEKNKIKLWWVQAESLSAFLNGYAVSGDERFLDTAVNIWCFIRDHIFDNVRGDWFAVARGEILDEETRKQYDARNAALPESKANKTKCPYHNTRACIEAMNMTSKLLSLN